MLGEVKEKQNEDTFSYSSSLFLFPSLPRASHVSFGLHVPHAFLYSEVHECVWGREKGSRPPRHQERKKRSRRRSTFC